MILGNAKGYTKMVMARFREIGYRPQLFLLNAADCGVPQRRERVFFVAIRNGIEAPLLKLSPTHRWVSAGEACADLRDDLKKYEMITASNQRHTLAGRTKPWPMTQPSPTLVAQSRDELIDEKKKFASWTYRDVIRLGSFPDDYHAKTDKIGKYMIGMSVPPKMTEAVARAVIDQWLMPKGITA
jgi:DNA (cytosine-5)-methyltransferase 1